MRKGNKKNLLIFKKLKELEKKRLINSLLEKYIILKIEIVK